MKALIGMFVNSDFGETGVTFDAEAYIQGSLFGVNFDVASAGAYAAWTDDGLMSFTMWMAVFLFDFSVMQQVPYYILNIQYQAQVTEATYRLSSVWLTRIKQTAFGVTQSNPCTLKVPSSPSKSIRETRSFISASYYYGIPMIANINIHVELVGWFELNYGVQCWCHA